MKNKGLAFKIYSILALMAISACAVVFIGIYELNKLNSIIEKVTTTYLINIQNVAKLNSNFQIQLIEERNFILANDDQKTSYASRIENKDQELKSILSELKNTTREEQKNELIQFEQNYVEWQKNFARVRSLTEENKLTEAVALSKTIGQSLKDKAVLNIEALNQLTAKYLDEYKNQAKKDYTEAKTQLIVISSLLTSLSFLISAFIISNISKRIYKIIQNLSDNSFEVTSASEQINRTSQELSSAAIEQSSSIEETTAAVTEMNSMLEKSLESAELSFDRSNEALERSLEGKAIMENVAGVMKEIDLSNEDIIKAVEKSNERIQEVTRIIANISEKTKVINEIVFQTKLLSFNASVEAARAGEHGRGFAVVAEEVGKLAALSGKSADEISNILNESIPKVKNIIQTSQEEIHAQILLAKNVTQKGVQISDDSINKLTEIFQLNEELNKLAESIANSSKEQSLGINETNQAMEQIHKATLINTNASHEASQASVLLNKEAKNLQLTILQLEELIVGANKNNTISKQIMNTNDNNDIGPIANYSIQAIGNNKALKAS